MVSASASLIKFKHATLIKLATDCQLCHNHNQSATNLHQFARTSLPPVHAWICCIDLHGWICMEQALALLIIHTVS
jgi:hypothetical protein